MSELQPVGSAQYKSVITWYSALLKYWLVLLREEFPAHFYLIHKWRSNYVEFPRLGHY